MGQFDEHEKRALLGHELAHLVNGDPNRRNLLRLAPDILAAQQRLLEPAMLIDRAAFVLYDTSG